MIYFDVTKTGGASHHSGLMRVSRRLAEALGDVKTVGWPDWNHTLNPTDWWLTSELFSEAERSGIAEFLDARRGRTAAIFHDAIPLKLPHITWPQSVARHPEYLKLLARFDRVWAVSAASKRELEGFWRWLGLERVPAIDVLPLGADYHRTPRVLSRPAPRSAVPQLLSLGILEPRKNQMLLLDVCDELWREGLKFELHLVGRVNPHFGPPILNRAKALARVHRGLLHVHVGASDEELARLFASARAMLFPTLAEGCGLPLLEALWMGVPCLYSDLPVLHENADAGGGFAVPVNDHAAWKSAIRRIVEDDPLITKLGAEAAARPLPTWSEAAMILRRELV